MSVRYDNIEQLDEMRKSGAISEDEYEKEKTRILRSADEPQKTVIQTRERSSFGSIVFGGIVLFALLAGFYFLFMQGDGASPTTEGDQLSAPDLESPVDGEGIGAEIEEDVTVTRGGDGGGGDSSGE